jgi:bifunctional non-homologous end joining protein LigD
MHARLDDGRVNVLTRPGNDWTDKYPTVAKALAELPTQSAYLDGELSGVLPDGRTAFNLIQNALERGDASLVYFVFDLLFLDGEDLTSLPLADRKTRLEAFRVGARWDRDQLQAPPPPASTLLDLVTSLIVDPFLVA